MFGSLRPPKDRFTSGQKELYQSHFCGLCHSLDAFGGKLASLLTNYDTTFFLITLAALEKTEEIERKPCTALFLRQVPVLRLSPGTRKLVAALTLALAGAKVEDDRQDGDRPWVSWAFLPLRASWKRAGPILDELKFPRDAIEGLGGWQRAVEAQAGSLPELAVPTQTMLASLFGFLSDYTQQPETRPALEELGRSLGLWIYLYDAWSDQARDRRSGAFNALLRFPMADQELGVHMLHALQHAGRALNHLPLGSRRPLLSEQLQRLRSLTLREFRPDEARFSGRSCWIGAGLAAASLQPQAAVACDSCDCGGCDGCDCSGCDCSGCDCGGCDACNLCDCNACDLTACDACAACNSCECGPCEGVECCDICDCCDPDCCDACKCSSNWDCCLCVDGPGQAKAVKQQKKQSAPKEGEIPGVVHRPKRKYPWSKKRRLLEDPLPEKPATPSETE
ncbi:MAG: DUF5685 family protein [Vulcanimicrobiota bacterium]